MPTSRHFALRVVELAVLSVAAVCGVAALAAHAGRWNDRLDLLPHFTLVWLAGSVIGMVAALWLQPGWARRAGLAFGAVGIVSCLALLAPDLLSLVSRGPPTTTTARLKVIEFNAWGRNDNPVRVAQWLAREDADVVVIIEATPILSAQIAAATGLHRFEGSGATFFTRQKPIAEWVAWGTRELPGESTELAWVDLPGPDGRPFTVVGLHLGWPIPARHAWGQDRKIAVTLATLDRQRAIMVGDFNSTQWSFRQRAADAAFGLERRDHLIPTWPARLPVRQVPWFPVPLMSIDHAYAGPYWKTIRIQRGPRMGSDHYPLVMTFGWLPPGKPKGSN